MTDEEYKEFLTALAIKHFRPTYYHEFAIEGHHIIEGLSATGRLNAVAAERPDSKELRTALVEELRHVSHYAEYAVNIMERAGVIEALDEGSQLLFENLRRSVIPVEDLEFLRNVGVRDPEAEITIIIYQTQRNVGRPNAQPTQILQNTRDHLNKAAELLASLPDNSQNERRPKRKIFGGIGKILAGTVTGVGNTLLGIGTIVAPNPATAYGVIASAAVAVGSIFQGIGDLRGE